MKKSAFMRWIDGELAADPGLAEEVDRLLGEMRLEQELVALREARGLTQRQAARLINVSQPYVAKLESGRVRNVGIATLVKYARALGADVAIAIRDRPVARTGARGKRDARRTSVRQLADLRGRAKWGGDLDVVRKPRPKR